MRPVVLALPLLLVATLAWAAQSGEGGLLDWFTGGDAPAATASAGAEADAQAIRARLGKAMKGVTVTSVTATPVAGLYEVVLDGAETIYTTADGGYLLAGTLYQVGDTGVVNITEQKAGELRRTALAGVDRQALITFPATGKEIGQVYVFTDVDCGYCRRFHQEVKALNAGGVSVHYLAFPRSGVGGPTYARMQAVWCAPDRRAAMTDSKKGRAVVEAARACKSPVEAQYRLGLSLNVQGTPAVFLADGTQVGGYLPAAQLLALVKDK